jgi:N-acetylglucosaminyldiphosphoundecaprenol N-acetyl-beta-D-mannosaminyltransferase
MQGSSLCPAGARLDIVGCEQLLSAVEARLTSAGEPLAIGSFNLDHITHFGTIAQEQYPDRALHSVDWLITPDGMPIVWWARRRLRAPVEQLAGSDLLPTIVRLAERTGTRIGFVGGWPDQHERLSTWLAVDFPGLVDVVFWAPTRVELSDENYLQRTCAEIRAAGIGLLIVGLGKPRQELWLDRNLGPSGARVGLAFGAAADFLSGTSKRAPRWLRRIGLEWLHRLSRDPRRLWRRYLVEGPRALALLLRS